VEDNLIGRIPLFNFVAVGVNSGTLATPVVNAPDLTNSSWSIDWVGVVLMPIGATNSFMNQILKFNLLILYYIGVELEN
jgi:hypothetical protein